MAINFTQAPKDNPFEVPKAGFYRFKIVKAEMKTPNDKTKNDYLNLQMTLSDKNNKKVGTMFDKVYDSESSALLYKAGRLVNAVGLELSGSVELKDLAKLLVNKEGILETEVDTYNNKEYAKVKTFGTECYWPLSELESLMGTAQPAEAGSTEEVTDEVEFIFDDSEAPADDY
jgi:hypothetical protein